MIARVIVIVISLLAAALQQPARDAVVRPQVGTAVLSGVVVTDDASPQPVRRARVMLVADVRANSQTATSDDTGRFVFRDVPAGRFSILTQRPPYLDGTYGATRPGRTGTPLNVSDGQTVSNLRITMTRGAAIEGRVTDPLGTPLPGATVTALRFVYSPMTGERTLNPNLAATADDRGIYRVFGLPPGEYIVMARAPENVLDVVAPGTGLRRLSTDDVDRALRIGNYATSLAGPPLGPPGTPVTWAPTYFPGTADLGAASILAVGAGDERSATDFTLDLVRTAVVSGVVSVPAGPPPDRIQVEIVRRGSNIADAQAGMPNPVRTGSDGRYSLAGVPPGSYSVVARTNIPAGRGGQPPGGEAPMPMLWAQADIVVDGRDLDVPLALRPGTSVSGRVVFNASTGAPPLSVPGLRMMLRGSDVTPTLTNQTVVPVDEQGAFLFTNMAPGKYRLTYVTSAAFTGWWRTSAMVNGQDVLDGWLEVRSAPIAGLTVSFTDTPSQITGTLVDATGRPATDYFIVVFTADRTFWTPMSRRVMQTRPGNDGAYRVTNLPAGEYLLAALTDVAPGDLNDAAFLAELVPLARKVTVTNGTTTVQPFRIGGG